MAIGFGETGKAVWAKVWNAENKGKYVKAQISTSRKDKDGNYVNSYWFANFVGHCVDAASDLSKGDSIKITAGQLENKKSDDGKSYVNMTIFGFETNDNSSQQQTAKRPVNAKRTQNLDVPPSREEEQEDELPW